MNPIVCNDAISSMKIILAPISASLDVVSFFNKYISSDNDAVYSEEFLCPDGIRAAIRRNQVVIAVGDNRIIGSLRFYRRKTQNIISLYQLAVDEIYRGQGLLNQMLEVVNEIPIEALCPVSSKFNEYYQKTGWKLSEQGEKFNRWILGGSLNIEYTSRHGSPIIWVDSNRTTPSMD